MKGLKLRSIAVQLSLMAALGVFASPASAQIGYIIDGNGQLARANNVSVKTSTGTALYDVSFSDDICFDGCLEAPAITFNNR